MSLVQTYSGVRFELLAPKPEMVKPIDIIVSLSKQCRFNGHVNQFYSVAEHCVRVSDIVSPKSKIWGFLHDAAEAYIGDIARPVRLAMKSISASGIDWSRIIKEDVSECIRERFSVEFSGDIQKEVEAADNILIATESRDLSVGPVTNRWTEMFEPLSEKLVIPDMASQYSRFALMGVKLGLWTKEDF